MKLKQIKIKNYKNITDLDQKINGNIIVVKGDNEKGKTTFARAFLKLITKVNKPEIPVTEGEKDGMIKGHFRDAQGRTWTVMYEFTNEKDKLSLITPDGITTTKVTDIRSIFNYSYIDVDEFISWSSTKEGRRKQRDVVLGLLTEEARIDFRESSAKEELNYKKRTDMSSIYRATKAIVETAAFNEEDNESVKNFDSLKDNLVSINRDIEVFSTMQQATKDIETANEYNENDIKSDLRIIEAYNEDIDQLEKNILRRRELVKEKESEIIKKKVDHQQKISNLLDLEKDSANVLSDYEVLTIENFNKTKENIIDEVDRVNNIINTKKVHANAIKELEILNGKITEITEKIDESRKHKAEIIANSNLPIKGLSIEGEEIFLNNRPFTKEQLSTSQIMTTVFNIMAALNKKTPIFHLGRAESLGSNNLKKIIEIARKNDYQVFFDKVEDDGDLKIEIIENHA